MSSRRRKSTIACMILAAGKGTRMNSAKNKVLHPLLGVPMVAYPVESARRLGAGTIVANFDGANKHRTTIGDRAHTGSNAVLVAPITVGEGATVGAGSTVAGRVPAGQLTVARARQATIENWTRPVKKKT